MNGPQWTACLAKGYNTDKYKRIVAFKYTNVSCRTRHRQMSGQRISNFQFRQTVTLRNNYKTILSNCITPGFIGHENESEWKEVSGESENNRALKKLPASQWDVRGDHKIYEANFMQSLCPPSPIVNCPPFSTSTGVKTISFPLSR